MIYRASMLRCTVRQRMHRRSRRYARRANRGAVRVAWLIAIIRTYVAFLLGALPRSPCFPRNSVHRDRTIQNGEMISTGEWLKCD